MQTSYPKLNIFLDRIAHNAGEILQRCNEKGISVSVVIKGVNADLRIIRTLLNAGVKELATSRLKQIEDCKNEGIECSWLLLRSSQVCECADTVRLCDTSLQTEMSILKLLEEECVRQNKTHSVILMKDMGDLREGYWTEEELFSDIRTLIKECPHIHIKGLGTNFGDYSAIPATPECLEAFAELGSRVEELLGRKLEVLSGGSTFVYPMVHDGTLPAKINHLRIGETILLAYDLPEVYKVQGLDYLCNPTMVIDAQIIEVKNKPSSSEGPRIVDGFGNIPEMEDKGIRKRAIVALGRQDIGHADKVLALDPGVEVIGATSDHMILDIEEAPVNYVPGDILHFRLKYEAMLYATSSPYLSFEYLDSKL